MKLVTITLLSNSLIMTRKEKVRVDEIVIATTFQVTLTLIIMTLRERERQK